MVSRRAALTVDSFSIAIGEHRVGLPPCRSLDTLLRSYLDLVADLDEAAGDGSRDRGCAHPLDGVANDVDGVATPLPERLD